MVKLKLEDIKLHTIFADVMVVNYCKDEGEEDRAPLVRAQKRSEYSMSSFFISRLTRRGVLKHKNSIRIIKAIVKPRREDLT